MLVHLVDQSLAVLNVNIPWTSQRANNLFIAQDA